MIHKHRNNDVYRRLYERYSRYFIEQFCAASREGHYRKHAFAFARIKLQDLIISEIVKNRKKTLYIVNVYQNIKKDQDVYEQAINCFHKYNDSNLGKE